MTLFTRRHLGATPTAEPAPDTVTELSDAQRIAAEYFWWDPRTVPRPGR